MVIVGLIVGIQGACMKGSTIADTAKALSSECGMSVSTISPLLLTEVFDNVEESVVVTDTARRIVYVNSATERLFGYKKSELYGKETKVFYAKEEDFSIQGKKRFNVASKAAAENYRVPYLRADGESFLGLTTGAVMRSKDGDVVGFIGIIRPARSADQSLDTLQKIHNITADVVLNQDQKIHELLKVGLEHFGLEIAIISHIIKKDYIVEYCVDLNEDLEESTVFNIDGTYCVHTLKENKTVGFHYVRESRIKHHPCYESFKLESYIGTPIYLDGGLYGTLNFSSVSPTDPFSKDDYILMESLADTIGYLLFKKKLEEELAALARTDELTGLPNRRATLERLSESIELSLRSGIGLCVLSIDLDHFKSINDTYGHAAGDAALVKFACVASGMGRKSDFCGRLGGEEFLFVLPGIELKFGLEFGNRLRERLKSEPLTLDTGEVITIKISAGLAKFETKESIDSFLARADEAMYAAKQGGRDRVCAHGPT